MKADFYPSSKLTEKIIGILFNIHNELGNIYKEKYYQRAIEIEFKNQKIRFEREKKIPVIYKGRKIGYHAVDFLIENTVILETKTIPSLSGKEQTQILRYLNYLQIKVGLLANFRTQRLELRRIVLPEKYLHKSCKSE